jgi:hypothetical protein
MPDKGLDISAEVAAVLNALAAALDDDLEAIRAGKGDPLAAIEDTASQMRLLASGMWGAGVNLPTFTCRHCERVIEEEEGTWIDPEAPLDTDDSMWREICDRNEAFDAVHEPAIIPMDDPRLAGMEAPLEGHGSCVVCLVGNHEVEHDPADHQAVAVHAVDGVPTSEPCYGPPVCGDCVDVLAQMEGVDDEGNALDIAEKDAEDEVSADEILSGWINPGYGSDEPDAQTLADADDALLGVVGPRTFTSTITPEAAQALADSPVYFTEATITVDGYVHDTADDSAHALVGWLVSDLVADGGHVSVDVKDSRGGQHAVEVQPRRILREHVLREAAGLLDQSPGHAEYVRALVEVTCRILGMGTEGNREDVEAEILRRANSTWQ